jgi:hypothetical protein
MSKFLYYLTTLGESALSLVGIRSGYAQPAYRVLQTIPPAVEIRHYDARTAAETPMGQGNDGAAFERLFRYITGANTTKKQISMTAPVEESSQLIAMTVPVEIFGGAQTMRFFLPQSVVQSGVPTPTDPQVHIVTLPPVTLGVIRFSGLATQAAREKETALLRLALSHAGKTTEGPPAYFSYDPPFTAPFLRRNEVALQVK